MKQKLERNKPSSSRIPSFTEWASGKYFFIQGEGLFFVFFLHKTSSSNWPIAAAFVLWIWVCSPGVWFMYALMCVCVCVCMRVCANHVCWVDTLGISPRRFSSPGVREPCFLHPRPLPSYLLGDCALNKFFCPRWSLRILLSLNFGENCFLGAMGVIWSDNGSFQDQTKPGHRKDFKKEEEKKNKNWDDEEFWEYICNIFNF